MEKRYFKTTEISLSEGESAVVLGKDSIHLYLPNIDAAGNSTPEMLTITGVAMSLEEESFRLQMVLKVTDMMDDAGAL